MLTQALALFRAEGLERAALDVDTQNPTGALRLYEKHGFEVVKETIHFTKSL
jgi:ribosomal protein S18 acetylase RimI-like enzyme